ncbi:MAG: hypothetical protein EXR28_08970 [Betaproteobacteria bacterium]|nr:hypothetical protein [Betaproteobacteria bacterium]
MKSNSRGSPSGDKGRFAEPIAIVGIGGVFPGAPTLAEFWRIVEQGRDTCRAVPAGRWILESGTIQNAAPGAPDAVFTQRGCFIDTAPHELEIPGLPPEFGAALDPNFHLLLEAGRAAFADARTAPIDRSRVGVILGNLALPTSSCSALSEEVLAPLYEQRLLGSLAPATLNGARLRSNPLNRYVTGLPAALLARTLGLGGVCYTLDAACASSLYAVKLACDELLAHRASAMLTGGLSRPDSLYTQMGFSQLRALSPSGRCSPFDAMGDGLIVGEGAGVLVLKRLQDALRDGDRIHAVIRGVGLSNDIDGNLLAPSSEGQLRALRSAYRQSGWSPGMVDLIECHATGTPVGDAVEFESLSRLWEGEQRRRGQCVLNAVKSNIGHLLTAAGSAGLIKTLLAMRHGVLPPVANFENPSDKVPLADSPFTILKKSRPWDRRAPGTPRRAAINGFGFGGNNAHLLIEEWLGENSVARKTKPPRALPPASGEPIAIVGMATRVGPWADLAAFTERVLGGDSDKTPRERKHWRGLDTDQIRKIWGESETENDKARNRKGGNEKTGNEKTSGPMFFPGYYLDDLSIPIDRFHISPRELAQMLPQQLLMLEVAKSALDDARNPALVSSRSGVFIGLGLDLRTTDFHFRWATRARAIEWARTAGLDLESPEARQWIEAVCEGAGPPLSADRTLGALGSIVASRLAREFRIGGPSHTICSEDTSGLQAVEVALRALQQGELDIALAGAVDLNGDLRTLIATDALRRYSRNGVARPFDVGADGPVPGEGAACVVLKRLSDAIRDGDRVYSVIRGVGTANTGMPDSQTSRVDAYLDALKRAYTEAGITSGNVQLVETHGSGARDEDVAEANALGTFFTAQTHSTPCQLGSVAADVGHAGAASGLLSLIKASLCLYREIIPGLRDCDAPLPELGGSALLRCNNPPRHWIRDRARGPRRAGVSTMGVEGNCIHIVLDACESGRAPDLVASPRFVGKRAESLLTAPARSTSAGKIAFVYPGSGNQFADMGRELALQWPGVLRAQDAENERLASQMAVERFWNGPLSSETLLDHRSLICAQVSFGAMMTDIAIQFGLKPDAAIGYSLGESTALFALRAWRQRDEMLARLSRSSLFAGDLSGDPEVLRRAWKLPREQAVEWVAGVVDRSVDAARSAIGACKCAYVLICNTPDECVIGGNRVEVEHIVASLGCHWFALQGVSTVHCELAHPVREAYREIHRFDTTPPAGVQFYSCGLGHAYTLDRESAADAIEAQAMDAIDFPRVIRAAYEAGVRTFIEMGPGNSCSRMIGRILEGRPHFAKSLAANNQEPVAQVLRVMGQLNAQGMAVNLDMLHGAKDAGALVSPSDTRPTTKCVTVAITGVPFTTPAVPIPPRAAPIRSEPARQAAMTHATSETVSEDIYRAMADAERATVEAHDAYLKFSQNLSESLSQAVAMRVNLFRQAALNGVAIADIVAANPDRNQAFSGKDLGLSSSTARSPSLPPRSRDIPRSLDRAACLEFGRGLVGNVLGPKFAEADAFPTRVRLPDEPLMLVDRILDIDALPLSMSHGRVVTEHDIHPGAWYLDCGRIPTCIAVEAGQADLFLSGFLGIDFQTRGRAMYRLLDAKVCFHRGLPGPGEVIRYDIYIERFFRQSNTWLFKFNFKAMVNGEPLLTMTEGCAGFFRNEELASGKGIVRTALDQKPMPGKRAADWKDLIEIGIESYSDQQLDSLRAGDLAAIFGDRFAELPVKNPVTLPGGRMKLVHRIAHLDPGGGRFGLGIIRGEADIHPEDWFLTCHFVDDRVMPGTLMFECCMHTLRVYLLRLGWIAEEGSTHLEPVPGVASHLKCRGQVLDTTQLVTYEISVREIGYGPEPYAIADALMSADGKPIVEISNMSLRYAGATRETFQLLWSKAKTPSPENPRKPAIVDYERILAFAIGKPSVAFGEPYRIFDEGRIIARLPGPPYQFLDRITEIRAEPWRIVPDAEIEAQYDVPPNAWYFTENRQGDMPFAILLEIALQPCGWLAAYMGSALQGDVDVSFRNLGGRATQLVPVLPNIGTLSIRVKLTRASSSAGMIIQFFDYEVHSGRTLVYKGDTYFGFFPKVALQKQEGLKDAKPYQPGAQELSRSKALRFPHAAPFPGDQLRMIDKIACWIPDGGPKKLGFIRATRRVIPDEWFFKAHFFQDPVVPGSLGLESFLQLLKFMAAERWGAPEGAHCEAVAMDQKHEWTYRGQIIPTDSEVTVEALVTAIDEHQRLLRADGYLSVDGRVIYAMKDFAVRKR